MFCFTATNLQLDHFSSYLKKKEKRKTRFFWCQDSKANLSNGWFVKLHIPVQHPLSHTCHSVATLMSETGIKMESLYLQSDLKADINPE